MKKFGFTLAEVLITLGIIGVVASLTAPALVSSSRNETNAAKLSVAISNFENALTSAIAKEGASDIWGTEIGAVIGAVDKNGNPQYINLESAPTNINKFMGEMKRYMNLSGYRTDTYYSSGPFALSSTGSRGGKTDLLEGFLPVETKNGITYFIHAGRFEIYQRTRAQVIALGGALYEPFCMNLFIDVNGPSAPNTIGRDIFAFMVGSNGILYPIGGTHVAILMEGNDYKNALWSEGEESEGKKGSYRCTSDSITDGGLGCTARLIEEDYKMNY